MWAGVQVPSLVSKYVKGLDGGVEETPCDVRACTNTAKATASCNSIAVLLSSQGVSLPK